MTTSQGSHDDQTAVDLSRKKMANGGQVMLSIGEDIDKLVQNRKESDRVKMHRVRQPLRKLKPEHYDAEEFSFGLFNAFPLESTKKPASHNCKLALASIILTVMDIKWPDLCEKVVPNPEEIQNLYDLETDTLSKDTVYVKCVLTLDAVFLACFLGLIFYPAFQDHWPDFKSALDSNFATMLDPLLKDLFKVENQIPLSLLRNVLRNLVQALARTSDGVISEDEILCAICKQALGTISHRMPGWALSDLEMQLDHPKRIIKDINFLECQNFLDCMYRMICPVEREGEDDLVVRRQAIAEDAASEQPRVEKRREKMNHVVDIFEDYLPTLTELRKANIECKGRRGKSLKVEFKVKWHHLGATLYLPTLKINDDTEAVWRNLVAYEESLYPRKGYSGHDFLHYLELMEKLIDTPNDVMLLKSGRKPVILEDALGSNEAVARIFNNTVLQKCYRGERSETWDSLHHQIYKFYRRIWRQWFWGFYEIYFSKPWYIISLFVATGLVAVTYYNAASKVK